MTLLLDKADAGRNPSNKSISRALVAALIEKTILEKNFFKLKKIEAKLRDRYGCTFSDCFEKPTFLKDVLKEHFPHEYGEIVNSIKNDLVNIVMSREIRNFIRVLEQED